MFKICKNMQNTQNMHSCFKNAALCIYTLLINYQFYIKNSSKYIEKHVKNM